MTPVGTTEDIYVHSRIFPSALPVIITTTRDERLANEWDKATKRSQFYCVYYNILCGSNTHG